MPQEPWEKFLRKSNRRGEEKRRILNNPRSERIRQQKIPIVPMPDSREYLLTLVPNLKVSSLDMFADFPSEIQDNIADDIKNKIEAGMKIKDVPEYFEFSVNRAHYFLTADSKTNNDMDYKPKLPRELALDVGEFVDYVAKPVKKRMERVERKEKPFYDRGNPSKKIN